MLKKQSSRTLLLALAAAAALPFGAFALNYSGSQKNQATFETLEEARVSGPLAVVSLEGNNGRTFKSHPVLDGYPKGTTYIYRSANLYGGRAAARLNTDILVFVEKPFANKDAALQYLKDLGLIQIIDEAIGSVILVTPADGRAFGASDQKYYYALQTAILAQKAGEGGRGGPGYSDAEYFGGFGYTYVIGLDGGATFLNNYVAGTLDYVSRIAGLLLINGKMEAVRSVAGLVPAYLVNAPEAVVEKYKKANDADAYASAAGVEAYFDQALPVKKVVVAKDQNPDTAKYIKDAYYNLFIKAMRVPVTKPGLHSASTPYQGYTMDQAPLSLCARNAVLNGVTADGIHVIRHSEDRFSDVKTPNGEYMQTWFEYLPEEALNGTAPAGTVPLILALHGGGDDPRQFVEEIGLLPLAGSERFAMVAPEHQNVANLLSDSLPKLVKYMLKTYPALDPSRVYVTGYSMGGAATLRAINGDPSVFAAAVPMAAAPYTGTAEQVAQFQKYHLPVMFTTSSFDLGGAFDQVNGNIATGYQTQLNLFLGYNGMKTINAYDFKTFPVNGFKADSMVRVKLNGEYDNYRWFLNNADGVPMVALAYTTSLIHALYPEYGKIGWEFFKHYSRDQKTGANQIQSIRQVIPWLIMIKHTTFGALLWMLLAPLAPAQPAGTTASNRIELGRLANGAAVTFVRSDAGGWGIEISGGAAPRLTQPEPAQIEVFRGQTNVSDLAAGYQSVQKEAGAVVAKAKVAGGGEVVFAVEDRWTLSGAVLSLSRKVSVTATETNAGFFSAIRLLTAPTVKWEDADYFAPDVLYGDPSYDGDRSPGGTVNYRAKRFAIREDMMSAPLFALSFRDGRWAAVLDLAPRGDTTLAETTASAATPIIEERLQFGALGARGMPEGGVELGFWLPGTTQESGGGFGRGTATPTVRRRYHPVKAGFSQSYQVGFRFGQAASFRDMERDAWRWAWESLKPRSTPVDVEVVRRTLLDHLDARVVTVEGRTGVPFLFDAVTGKPGSYRRGPTRPGTTNAPARAGGPGRAGNMPLPRSECLLKTAGPWRNGRAAWA